MLVMNRPRLSTCSIGSPPCFQSATRTLPASMPVSTPTNGMGSVSANAARTCLRLFARFHRRRGGDIFRALLRRAAFMDGRQAEIAGQTAGGGPGVHPGQFKRNHRQRKIFGPGDETALLRVKKSGGDTAFVKVREQRGLVRRPFVRIAPAAGDEPRDRPAGHVARGLNEHLQFIAIGKAPHDLADVIAGQGLKGRVRFGFGKCFHKIAFVQCDIDVASSRATNSGAGIGRPNADLVLQ